MNDGPATTLNVAQFMRYFLCIVTLLKGKKIEGENMHFQKLKNKDHSSGHDGSVITWSRSSHSGDRDGFIITWSRSSIVNQKQKEVLMWVVFVANGFGEGSLVDRAAVGGGKDSWKRYSGKEKE